MIQLLPALKEKNLSVYYLLPALGLSEHSFGEGNFVNSYVSEKEGKYFLLVELLSVDFLPKEFVLMAKVEVKSPCSSFLWYEIPTIWHQDVQNFKLGAYSKFTRELKDLIIRNSGLAHMYEKDNKLMTDIRLLALDKDPVLLESIVKDLYSDKDYEKGKAIVQQTEYLPPPDETEFI